MNDQASWHADGLRWIGSLFYGAANFLDRPAYETLPQQHPAAPALPADDYVDNVRFRMHIRGLL